MEMKYIKKYLYIALILPFLTSCSDAFLENEPYGVSTDEVYFSTIDGIGQGVTGVYANVNTLPAGLHNLDIMYLVFGTIASDESEAGGEIGGNDFIDIQDADKGTIQPAEPKSLSDNFWAYNYKTILRANSVLNGIKSYRAKNTEISSGDDALLNQYEGEAEFLLAFTHFKMTQIYGGIPIVDHELGSTEYSLKRNSIAECLHFVQEHLLIAVEKLPVLSSYPASEYGRVTKGAAQSLLAKAYLYESSYAENYGGDARFEGCTNQFASALKTAEDVINSGEYHLVGIDGETFDTFWNQDNSTQFPDNTPGYRYIFSIDGETSKEHIFATQSINDGFDYMSSRGSYLNIYMAVRNVNESSHGWGFNCPTQDLKNAFDPGDLRAKVAIGNTGDPIYLADGWGTIDCQQSPTNMISRKYEVSFQQYGLTPNSAGPSNFPFIRYADVVLMAAEAAVKTGDSGKALKYVNMVRKRARNGAATGVPADLTSCSFDDVVKERQLELCLEGHRFFDLVRWKKQDILVGQPLQKFRGGVEQEPAATCQFTLGKNDFFPIPLTEIVNTNYSLEQYPGWN
jgi:hypothetical protein